MRRACAQARGGSAAGRRRHDPVRRRGHVGPVLADEDRVHRGLHVVIDAPRAGAAEEGERLVVSVEHHLLGLAGIGPDEEHPAVAQPDVGHLDRGGHSVDDRDLVAPVELEGFAGIEAQRHVGCGGGFGFRLRPARGVAPDCIIAALVAQGPELLEDPDAGQMLTLRTAGILDEQAIEFFPPRPDLRLGLHGALVAELGGPGADHLPDRLPRHAQLAADILDRLAVLKMPTPDLRDRLHNQHPKSRSRFASGA